MRKIYLARHGHPDFLPGARICLGRTDVPLGSLGRMQACLLGEILQQKKISAVFASPLARCRQTAEALHLPVTFVPDLVEQNMGCWDGMDFDSIRASYPELYQARKGNPLLVPEGAETLEEVKNRAMRAMRCCLENSIGDIAVVAHASVIQAILSVIAGIPLAESFSLRLPYGAFSTLTDDGYLHILSLREIPHPEMTPDMAEKLLSAAAPGERIIAHSRAVAEKAVEITDNLPLPLDRQKIVCAALLHDVARTFPKHAEVGAEWLQILGYEEISSLVRQHHDLQSTNVDEAAILYISDKCIREDLPVTLEERFRESALRCKNEEAVKAHTRRLQTAKKLQQTINSLSGREIIR